MGHRAQEVQWTAFNGFLWKQTFDIDSLSSQDRHSGFFWNCSLLNVKVTSVWPGWSQDSFVLLTSSPLSPIGPGKPLSPFTPCRKVNHVNDFGEVWASECLFLLLHTTCKSSNPVHCRVTLYPWQQQPWWAYEVKSGWNEKCCHRAAGRAFKGNPKANCLQNVNSLHNTYNWVRFECFCLQTVNDSCLLSVFCWAQLRMPTFGPSFPGFPIGPLTPGSPCLDNKSDVMKCINSQEFFRIPRCIEQSICGTFSPTKPSAPWSPADPFSPFCPGSPGTLVWHTLQAFCQHTRDRRQRGWRS